MTSTTRKADIESGAWVRNGEESPLNPRPEELGWFWRSFQSVSLGDAWARNSFSARSRVFCRSTANSHMTIYGWTEDGPCRLLGACPREGV